MNPRYVQYSLSIKSKLDASDICRHYTTLSTLLLENHSANVGASSFETVSKLGGIQRKASELVMVDSSKLTKGGRNR